MKEIKIYTPKEYSVLITSGSSNFYSLFDSNKIRDIFIVTDETVWDLHSGFMDALKEITLGIKIFKAGEVTKHINSIMDLYKELIKYGANKKTAIVSLGGGVIGDISGFAASTYMRGINLVQVPTTLMSQCDSSIGGKNGFNFNGIKNIIGTFYQPNFVYSNVNFIKTLNEKEYKNGLAEILKYGFVCDDNLFRYIEQNKMGIEEREIDKLLHIIYESALIKGRIVEKDEYDINERQILNFGHTIGHGIESACNFNITHGEAIAIGMNLECIIAMKMGYLDYEEYNRFLTLLKYFNLPVDFRNMDFDFNKIIEFINKDKKKVTNNIKFVLPHKIGHAIITSEIKKNMVCEIIREMAGV